MKNVLFALVLSAFCSSAEAREIRSEDTNVPVARITQLVTLASTPEIQVNLVVEDLGGSTDVAPTQRLHLALYSKGEMFSTDAAFHLGDAVSFNGVKRVGGGLYEIRVMGLGRDEVFEEATYLIDARRAIVELKNVDCGDEFDCSASENFQSEISLVRK